MRGDLAVGPCGAGVIIGFRSAGGGAVSKPAGCFGAANNFGPVGIAGLGGTN